MGINPTVLPAAVQVIAMMMLSTALVLAVFRLIRGPSTPDRVVALDLISTLTVGTIAVYGITTGQPVFIDVAIVLALISFLGTIGFAYYVEQGASRS
jgi:multicomponent Na+:H+ antiporter subunit F